MVWVGSAQFELWRRDPLPIAVYESASLARRGAIHALAQQGRRYRVVYHSSSLVGKLQRWKAAWPWPPSPAACHRNCRCSAPNTAWGRWPPWKWPSTATAHRAAQGTVDSLQNLLMQTLRQSGGARATA